MGVVIKRNHAMETKTKSVTLTLTEDCNLNCTYCYENHKTHRLMDFGIAKSILETELNGNEDYDIVAIDLFGGEPFLAFDLMQKIVSYLRTQTYKKRYFLSVSTNGTLVHGDIQKWLIENSDLLTIGLSLDGTKEMHDINRCNSFDLIDLDFYKKYYSDQSVKMTISQESLSQLFEGVKFCHENGLTVNCNLAYGIDWSNPNNKEILERELMKLINYYIDKPNITPCSIIGSAIHQIGYDGESKLSHKWCGAGTHISTYDVEGNQYPCQFFTPLSAGEEKSKKAKTIEFLDYIPDSLLSPECVICPIKEACPTCYGSNYVSTGNIYQKDINMCELTKIIILARSFYYAKLLSLDRISLDEVDRQALIRAIVKIQTELND